MILSEIVVALLCTFFVSLVFLLIFGYKGAWGNFWTFYLIVFSVTLFSTLFIGPNNNQYPVLGWLPIFFVSMLSATTLAAVTIPLKKSVKWNTHKPENTTIVADNKMIMFSAIVMISFLLLFAGTLIL